MTKNKSLFTPLNFFLALLVIISVFLRFYNLEGSLMFQGDQGRDAMMVADIFKDKDPVFIGPVTSIGNMYLGPFYYYLMLPFLWASYPSPMGPVYMIAAVGVISVVLFYFLMKKIYGQKLALIGSLFFALSHTAVFLSRFSWNPNPAPLFSLLMFYFTWLAWQKDERYWLLVSAMFSILVQLHYVTLLSAGGAGLIYLASLIEKIKIKKSKAIIRATLLSMLVFLLSLTPLILFDIKHQGNNIQAFQKIITKEESFDLERKSGRTGFSAISKFFTIDLRHRSTQILFESNFGSIKENKTLFYLTLILLIFYLLKNRSKLEKKDFLLFAYLGTGLIGISFYQHEVYTHYFAYLLPMVFLFYAWMFTRIKKGWLFYLLFLPFLGFFIKQNLSLYSLNDTGWTIKQMQMVTDSIYEHLGENEKYNLVLLSESGDLYGMNYRYFLSTKTNPPLAMEDHHQAEKLVIINEERATDQPMDLPIYEIIVFPHKNVLTEYEFDPGPKITILGEAESAYNDN